MNTLNLFFSKKKNLSFAQMIESNKKNPTQKHIKKRELNQVRDFVSDK